LAAAQSAYAAQAPVAHSADRDCGDFSTQAAAQAYFLSIGGPRAGPR
jgi:hypothetical protein